MEEIVGIKVSFIGHPLRTDLHIQQNSTANIEKAYHSSLNNLFLRRSQQKTIIMLPMMCSRESS